MATLRAPSLRQIAPQVLALVTVVVFVWWIVGNVATNLARMESTAGGFGFLGERAGFDILQRLIPYTSESTYLQAFFVGLLNTLLVAALGVVFATIIGFLVGVGRLSSNWLIARLCTVFVETLRNIPLLLQLIFWHEAVLALLPAPREAIQLPFGTNLNVRGLYLPAPVGEPGFMAVAVAFVVGVVGSFVMARWARHRRHMTGRPFPVVLTAAGLILGLPLAVFLILGTPLHWEPAVLQRFNYTGGVVVIPELGALLIGLSLYTAAFIAEVVRGGILAVPRGQVEAARAVGLSPGRTMRLVVVPQALRVIVPPLTNQYLNLTKNSSLAVAVGYPDLVGVFKNTVLNQTGLAIEVISMTMAVYLLISLVTAGVMNWLNFRVALRER